MKNPTRNTKLSAWLKAASPEQAKLMLYTAGFFLQQFQQYASGRRIPKAGLALKIEEACAQAASAYSDPKLPTIAVDDICPDCKQCPYLKAVRASRDGNRG